MILKKAAIKYTTSVSESFEKTDENFSYEVVFRRWLVGEIEAGRMSVSEAVKRFGFNPESGRKLIHNWRKKYASEMVLTLPEMTETERQQIALLKKQLSEAEQRLEDAKMKNIALNMLIDVAEERLKISIRKKPGAKQ
jgi:transposase